MGRLKITMLWTDGSGPVTREEVIETSYPWAYVQAIGDVVSDLLAGMLNEVTARHDSTTAAAGGAQGDGQRVEAGENGAA